MKSIYVILILILYSIPTVGLTITFHYCSGNYSSFSFGNSNTPGCSCGMKKKCCEDKTITIKIVDEQSKTKTIDLKITKLENHLIKSSNCIVVINQKIKINKLNNLIYPPPINKKQQLFILYESLII